MCVCSPLVSIYWPSRCWIFWAAPSWDGRQGVDAFMRTPKFEGYNMSPIYKRELIRGVQDPFFKNCLFFSYYVSGKLEETTDAPGLLLGPDWNRRGRGELPCILVRPLACFDIRQSWSEVRQPLAFHVTSGSRWLGLTVSAAIGLFHELSHGWWAMQPRVQMSPLPLSSKTLGWWVSRCFHFLLWGERWQKLEGRQSWWQGPR